MKSRILRQRLFGQESIVWLVGTTLCLVISVTGSSKAAAPVKPVESAAERGYRLLTEKPFLPADFNQEIFEGVTTSVACFWDEVHEGDANDNDDGNDNCTSNNYDCSGICDGDAQVITYCEDGDGDGLGNQGPEAGYCDA